MNESAEKAAVTFFADKTLYFGDKKALIGFLWVAYSLPFTTF